MKKFTTTVSAAALVALTAPAGMAATIIIDDFTTSQRVSDTDGPNTLVDVFAPEAIGDRRDMFVTTDQKPRIGGSVLESNGGLLSFSNASNQTGEATLVYDGLAGAGLGGASGLDLTDNGTNNRFLFSDPDGDLPGTFFLATVTDINGASSEYDELFDLTLDPFLRFSEFTGLAEFDKVASITFTFDTRDVANFDGSISRISVVPLPASALLLLGGLGGFAGLSAANRRRRRKEA